MRRIFYLEKQLSWIIKSIHFSKIKIQFSEVLCQFIIPISILKLYYLLTNSKFLALFVPPSAGNPIYSSDEVRLGNMYQDFGSILTVYSEYVKYM